MLLSKLQISVLLLVVIGVAGVGWGRYRAWANDQPPAQSKQQQVAQVAEKTPADHKRDPDAAKKDLDKMQGTWQVVSSQVADEEASEDEVKKRIVTVKGDTLIYEYGNERQENREGTIKLDPKTKAFDWIITSPERNTMLAIYELKGDDLRIGFGNDGLVRPKRFDIAKEDVVWLLVLKRKQP